MLKPAIVAVLTDASTVPSIAPIRSLPSALSCSELSAFTCNRERLAITSVDKLRIWLVVKLPSTAGASRKRWAVLSVPRASVDRAANCEDESFVICEVLSPLVSSVPKAVIWSFVRPRIVPWFSAAISPAFNPATSALALIDSIWFAVNAFTCAVVNAANLSDPNCSS